MAYVNIEDKKEANKKWYNANKDRTLEQASRNYFLKKEEKSAANKKWRDNNKEHITAYRLKNKERYKIWHRTKKDKLYSLATRPRSPVCEICDEKAQTVYDHDHKTGEFRGWLCHKCNRFLGWIDQDLSRLEKIRGYLGL